MSDNQKLFWVRFVHTFIYIIMAMSSIYVLMAGLVGAFNTFVLVAIGLIVIEGIIFFGNGMRCPLTDIAKKYGAEKGYVFDTFLPEQATKYTFRFFGLVFAIGLALVLFRAFS